MDTNDLSAKSRQAGRLEWVAVAVLTLPTMLVALDLTVLYLAVPHLSADLGATSTQQLWITDIYGFLTAGFLITMGTLGDRIGRRRLLMIGAACFALFSVLAAYANSPELLIFARALLGVAGATLIPSILALISNMFPDPRQRTLAIAVWTSCLMGGTAIGPLVGGALLENFWWGSVFLLGVPVMLVLLVTAPLLVPEYRAPAAGKLDPLSVLLSLVTILPVIYGIKELANGPVAALPVAAILVGAAAGVVFVIRERGLAQPLLDLRLFADRSFRAAAVVLMFGTGATVATYFFVSQYLQLVAEYSPLVAGLWLMPSSAALVAGAMFAPAVAQRFGPGKVIAAGMALAAVGYLLLLTADGAAGPAIVVAGLCVVGLGSGPNSTLGTALLIGAAPPEKAGSAGAIATTCGDFGMALGVAVLGSVSTAVYRGQIGATLPDGLPPDVAEATRDTLASGVAAAARLAEPSRTSVLGATRDAFTAGLHTIALLSAVLAIALAVLAALRNGRPPHGG